MSKSLEALERLKNTLLAEGYWQDVLQDVFTIEKDLKEKEELENGEEKLGIDLVIGVTALVNGVYTQQFGYISGDSLVLEKYRIGIPSRSIALPFTGPAGYGKTWTLALVKEGSKA